MRTVAVLSFLFSASVALHVRGSFKPTETPFAFISKFGFQRTISTDDVDTRGYIFGNVSSNAPLPEGTYLTLSLLPGAYYSYFSDSVAGKSAEEYKNATCAAAFAELSAVAYDSTCNPNGFEDFLRRVPCVSGHLCPDEDRPDFVVKENQLTFIVEDFQHPRFWYLTIVSCYRNSVNCDWLVAKPPNTLEVKYDLWLVNGNPYKKAKNPLEYQFSFEKQDTVELYLIFTAAYVVMIVVSWWNWYLVERRVAHPACVLFMSISFMLLGLACVSLDVCLFAVDGVGLPVFGAAARVFRTFSQDILVFLLVAIASGWGLFYPDAVSRRKLLLCSWLAYFVVSLSVNASKIGIEGDNDSDAVQAWPDVAILILRSTMAVLFMRELRSAFSRPERPTLAHFPTDKQRETLLRFGAAGLVWFVGVPLVELVISTRVDVFWRFKIALGLTYGVDAVAHACLCHLLWAKRYSEHYGFNGTVVVSSSPSPFLVDSLTQISKPADVFVHKNGRALAQKSANGFSANLRRFAAGDGSFSDAEVRRSLLEDGDSDGDLVELLNVRDMKS